MPHIIMYGPDGSGKSTRVNCLLKEIYGSEANKVKTDYFSIKHNSKLI